MEVIRKFIDASSLMSIMALPETFRNRKLEIIILPTDEDTSVQQKADLTGIVQSLLGAIPYTDPRKGTLNYQTKQFIDIGGITINSIMKYKGFSGNIEFSKTDCCFFGKVLGIRAMLSYEGSSTIELESDFHEVVENYLALCEAKEKSCIFTRNQR